jgi:hypothetical protein
VSVHAYCTDANTSVVFVLAYCAIDPDDRKDGLWVWGLFKEPLYPFLLFQLEVRDIPLASAGIAEGDKRIIPAGKLYAKVAHRRDKQAGAQVRRCTTTSTIIYSSRRFMRFIIYLLSMTAWYIMHK